MLPKLGRYETIKKIASGGMATVYLGRVVGEGGFERLVALKLMHPHIANDPDFVAMFLDEARLAAKIRHPNVVATIDIQKTTESLFIVMEYIDGPTLQEIRKHLKSRNEQIPLGVTVRIFMDILSGLQEAHDLEENGQPLNLVHRDVSPHNILIGTDGVAKLTDFGVAKAEARISSTRGGQLKGKIAYMPPEQILTEPVTRRADVYSAGVCLWEALVGKRLFRAANDGAMVHMILEGQTQPPSAYVDDVPKAIEDVVMKAVSRRPEARFAEALDLADALEDAARRAGVRIPRAREVGGFIKEVKVTLGDAPASSSKSFTPPSQPGVQPARSTHDGSHSQPSMPSIGTGPSLPQTSEPSAPQVAVAAAPPVAGGPPPIPELALDAVGAPRRPRPLPRPAAATEPLPSAPQIPTMPPADTPSLPAEPIAPRMSFPRAQVDDEATTVMPREAQEAFDTAHSSGVTSPTGPTQTEVTYSLRPTPSRHGVIAVVVAGVFAVGVLIAVLIGGPDPETSAPSPAHSGAQQSPLFPETSADDVPSAVPTTSAGAETAPVEPPPIRPAPAPAPPASAEPPEPPPVQPPVDQPKPRPLMPPRPKPPDPKPAGSQFRPTEL